MDKVFRISGNKSLKNVKVCKQGRTPKRAQWVNTLATKSDSLGSTPGTHVEEEKINSLKLSSDLH